jgi:hypothetical protein
MFDQEISRQREGYGVFHYHHRGRQVSENLVVLAGWWWDTYHGEPGMPVVV